MGNLFILGRSRHGKTSKLAFLKGPRGKLTKRLMKGMQTEHCMTKRVLNLLIIFVKKFMKRLTQLIMKGIQGVLTGQGVRGESRRRLFGAPTGYQCSSRSTTKMGRGESKEEEPKADALVQEMDNSTSILHVNLTATLVVSICALLVAVLIVICLFCVCCRIQLGSSVFRFCCGGCQPDLYTGSSRQPPNTPWGRWSIWRELSTRLGVAKFEVQV